MNLTQVPEAVIARQPIFDREMNAYAYELLFRSSSTQEASNITDGDSATTELILNAFTEIGLIQVVDNKVAFINLTTNLILDFPPVPTEQVVLEILEDVKVDTDIVTAVKKLSEQGYTIALDDFEYDESWDPLIEIASIIKIDIQALTKEQLEKHVELLKDKNVKLLAEKVETHEEYEFCKALGFDYFQGYFLSKPNIVAGKKTSTNKLVIMKLICELQKRDISIPEIEKLLSEDPKLSYKLLQIINSAAYIKAKKIESLHQAVVFLGLHKLREWASLIALSQVDDKPNELMVTTMVRAKMCELIAASEGSHQIEAYYTAGLFSTLDALMDDEIEELMNKLPISEDIKQALINKAGPMGKVLKNVIAYERAEWSDMSEDVQAYSTFYFTIIDWANEASKALNR